MQDYCRKFFTADFKFTPQFFIATATVTVYASNTIEDSGCDIRETTRLIDMYSQDPLAAMQYDNLSPEHAKQRREVLQHFKALQLVHTTAVQKQPLSVDLIKSWHAALMESLVDPCGEYRTEGVFAGQRIFIDHELIPSSMDALIEQCNERLVANELSPWALAAWLSHAFVSIHPFADGNGRLCRLLVNYILWYYGFAFAVPISTSRKDYMSALRFADRDYSTGGRRTGKLALLILKSAHQIAQNH